MESVGLMHAQVIIRNRHNYVLYSPPPLKFFEDRKCANHGPLGLSRQLKQNMLHFRSVILILIPLGPTRLISSLVMHVLTQLVQSPAFIVIKAIRQAIKAMPHDWRMLSLDQSRNVNR